MSGREEEGGGKRSLGEGGGEEEEGRDEGSPYAGSSCREL